MRILALEPYYGGSHKALLDGWIQNSEHRFTVSSLPAYKWKWRMRHSGITLAEEVKKLISDESSDSDQATETNWDAIFCSDMLPLAEFRGLVPTTIAKLPTILYFHENQLTYPNQQEHQQGDRDHHYAFTNFVSAVAADRIWFNSQFHHDEFFGAFEKFLAKMPDYSLSEQLDQLRGRTEIQSPGISDFPERAERKPGPLRILWNARWEHDKNPETFFAALRNLRDDDVDFRVSVVGESFAEQPSVFERAKSEFADVILNWGFVTDRAAYEQILLESDVVVSTANHEFFGISIAEAAMAGAIPVVPSRLAYPEIFHEEIPENNIFFYTGEVAQLTNKLKTWAKTTITAPAELFHHRNTSRRLVAGFAWSERSASMDESVNRLITEKSER